MSSQDARHGIFMQKYGEALRRFGRRIAQEDVDYVLALSRKGPRLLELLTYFGIDYSPKKIITEKALDFISSEELSGSRILLIDDIVILGSTLNALVRKVNSKYPDVNLTFFPFAVHNKFIPEYISPDYYEIKLNESESYVFCHELVRLFHCLNKPYDLDYSIFYTDLNPIDIQQTCVQKGLDRGFDITTLVQRKIGRTHLSFIPDHEVSSGLIKTIFRNPALIHPQIDKIRLFGNTETNTSTLVPMFTFDMEPTNNWSENPFNKVFEIVDEKTLKSFEGKVSFEAGCCYKLAWYLISFASGLAFLIRNDLDRSVFSDSKHPSDILERRDLDYIFGPTLSSFILERLDDSFPLTYQRLKNLSRAQDRNPTFAHFSAAKSENLGTTIDSKRRPLLKAIQPYINKNVRKHDLLSAQLATIFEGMFNHIEVPQREYARKMPQQYPPVELADRLKNGFRYDQIREILVNAGVFNPNGRGSEIALSLSVDYLVDLGVMVPMFAESESGWERVYRYGEDGKCAQRLGYLLADVFKSMFSVIRNEKGTDEIPKIPLEKILVLLNKKIAERSLADALECSPDCRDQPLFLNVTYCVHGQVLAVSSESFREEGPRTEQWMSKWCIRQGILAQGKGNKCFKDSGEFWKSNPPDQSPVDSSIRGQLRSIAKVLYHIDSVADRSRKHHYLIALTSCDNAEHFIEAIREEVRLFFRGREYTIFDVIKMLDEVRGYLKKRRLDVDGLIRVAKKRSNNADIAINQVFLKQTLYSRREEIIQEIKRYFEQDTVNHHLKDAFDSQVSAIIPSESAGYVDKPVQKCIDRTLGLAEVCVSFSAIIKLLVSLTQSLVLGSKAESKRVRERNTNKFTKDTEKIKGAVTKLNNALNTTTTRFDNIDLKDLPRINEINVSSTEKDLPAVSEWSDLLQQEIAQLEKLYSSLNVIYNQYYGDVVWETERKRLFGKAPYAPHRYLIQYDTKDSSDPDNRERTRLLKGYINEKLEKLRRQIEDGKFVVDKNDEKTILIVNEANVRSYLNAILDAHDDYDLYCRIGVSSKYDMGEDIITDPETGFEESELNFIFVNRLRDYKKERNRCHTLYISFEAKQRAWNSKLSAEEITAVLRGVGGKPTFYRKFLKQNERI